MRMKISYASDHHKSSEQEINSLEDLMSLAMKEGHNLILHRPLPWSFTQKDWSITVYDDYVE